MNARTSSAAYLVAARRTVLARIGGLHRQRRIEELSHPVVRALVADARFDAALVDALYLGNTTAGDNPARLVALAAGLAERATALTFDSDVASGLDAVIAAMRTVAAGDAEAIVAGGAESLSTAPWRIGRPTSLYATPRFIVAEPGHDGDPEASRKVLALEALATRRAITREAQDEWAMRQHMKAGRARMLRRLVREIVPLRANAEEARDQSAIDPTLEDIQGEAPYVEPNGTLTPANRSHSHDGAAFVLVVNERTWQRLGKPPALQLAAVANLGVPSREEAEAPIAALRRLRDVVGGLDPASLAAVEMAEASAAQAIALAGDLDIADDILNPTGGALVRGLPGAAAGAVLAVRLYHELVRTDEPAGSKRRGIAVVGAAGGLGLAALLETAG
jgi:acetyl-CoA C-acetyltransferase